MQKKYLSLFAAALLLAGCDQAVSTLTDEPEDGANGAMMENDEPDAVMMLDGKMMMRADGQTTMMDDSVMMENGMEVMMDGIVKKSDGTMMQMEEGMMMDMEGSMQMMDADMMMDAKSDLKNSGMMEGGAMMGEDSMMADGDEDAEEENSARSMYSLYAPEVLADGQTKVLFFHASWCPVCKGADATLRTLYNSWDDADMTIEELIEVLPGRSTYKVDYDTEVDLKARYGVTYQHTFVVVDGEGNMISKIQGPTDEQLKALLQ